MIYRQTANPNATNSELDAKIVITKEDRFEEWLSQCPDDYLFYSRFIDVKLDVESVAETREITLTNEQRNNVIDLYMNTDWSYNNDAISELIDDELRVAE